MVPALFDQLVHAPRRQLPRAGEQLDAPADQGMYVIYGPDGRAEHVGRTPRARGGIRQRLQNHLAGRSSFVRIFLKGDRARLRTGYEFQSIAVPDTRMRALLEAYAIGQLCPAHIGLATQLAGGAACDAD